MQADLAKSEKSAVSKQQQLDLVSEQLTVAEGDAENLKKLHSDTVDQLHQQETLLHQVSDCGSTMQDL